MTVPRINALLDYWRDKCPPACRSLAAQIGFKPKQQSEGQTAHSKEEQEKAIEEVMSMFPMRAPPALPLVKPGDQNG